MCMKSVKPGRGPSMMGGFGGILAAIFGLFWIGGAANIGAPAPFLMFGVVFVVVALVNAVYNFYNAAGENRFSEYDITEDGEEPDPLEKRQNHTVSLMKDPAETEGDGFCPYCGAKTGADYTFCRKCGKKLEV